MFKLGGIATRSIQLCLGSLVQTCKRRQRRLAIKFALCYGPRKRFGKRTTARECIYKKSEDDALVLVGNTKKNPYVFNYP